MLRIISCKCGRKPNIEMLFDNRIAVVYCPVCHICADSESGIRSAVSKWNSEIRKDKRNEQVN
jgi:hypothetical protein